MVEPPDMFGIVDRNIMRSNLFKEAHFPFIQRKGLRTVVNLHSEAPARNVCGFLEREGVALRNIGVELEGGDAARRNKRRRKYDISVDLVKRALEIVLDEEHHPVLVMCQSGVHQTGTLVGCLRKLQCWSFTAVLDEFTNFAAGSVTTYYFNKQFIENFDTDLVVVPVKKHAPAEGGRRSAPTSWFVDDLGLEDSLLPWEEEDEDGGDSHPPPSPSTVVAAVEGVIKDEDGLVDEKTPAVVTSSPPAAKEEEELSLSAQKMPPPPPRAGDNDGNTAGTTPNRVLLAYQRFYDDPTRAPLVTANAKFSTKKSIIAADDEN